MPRPRKGPRFGGSPAHDRLMMANLATDLFMYEKVRTTEAKAKAVRPLAEKLITKARNGDLHSRRVVLKTITNKDAVHKLFEEVAASQPAKDADIEVPLELAYPGRFVGCRSVFQLDRPC